MDYQQLVQRALIARQQAYAPYSNWQVGAALLCKDGTVFTGCNIENSAYGPTVCAERTAIFKAVSEGYRDFVAISIVGGNHQQGVIDYCYPCGVCRQVMSEFCDPDTFVVVVGKQDLQYETALLKELIPYGAHVKRIVSETVFKEEMEQFK